MILQSLHELYQRLAEDPQNGLPMPGYSQQNITFCIVIKSDGSLVEIQPCKQETIEIGKNGKEKKTSRPLSLLLPGQAKPSGSGLNPCFLWDNTGYMLGYKPADPKKSPADQEKEQKRTLASFAAFKQRHLELESTIADPEFTSVCRFLENWSPELASDHPNLAEITSGFGVFQISGKLKYVHQSPNVTRWWAAQDTSSNDAETGFCLVTGKNASLALLHDPAIKGVAGAQSMGAKLVSFNLNAFTSQGKEQGFNSPVSENAAFSYCNALNWLLARKERRFRVGDATTVFWTEKPTPVENLLPWMMSGVPDAEDDATKKRIQSALEKISHGTLASDELGDANVRYFILGLSPNAARLSVRFWHTGTLGELLGNLKLHFDHLRIVRQWDETNSKNPDAITPTAYQLLRQTSRDADGIPPLLGGVLMRSILLGTPYPENLITSVINRIHAEREINYLKASILKAWLIRNHQQHITTMLDESNTNPGYRLGRLFAVLEKTQQDALPNINATIRDRFYSSASATPRAVFGRLLRMYPNHLGKAQSEWTGKIGVENAGKRKNGREILCQEILDSISDFPAHLNLQNQAQFALGYYHQRKAFYPSESKNKSVITETTNTTI
ncbi:MAG: type I-C CRISPR-associated protein Cas8c/Csd1 [Luteolibacter sp.]